MEERILNFEILSDFERDLRDKEKSNATIEKYVRDIRCFFTFVNSRCINKEITLEYKMMLAQTYTIASANSMIAALNTFLHFMGWCDCCIKQYKVQRQVFRTEEKELTKAEYIRLVNTAKSKGNERLHLILQTICSTGIRVSELQYVTVESAQLGKATVNSKGKIRIVFIVPELKKILLQYAKKQGIISGAIFITKTGKPVNRCNIWREMKSLCKQANVEPSKVFPHNLRHLFARTFYGVEKDIAKLADILGHSSINTTRIYIMTTGVEHLRKMQNMKLII